jgi:type III secretion protein C
MNPTRSMLAWIRVGGRGVLRAVLFGLVAAMVWTGSHAGAVPWRQRQFDLQAQNEPLNTFLLRLLTIEGIASTLSATVASGRVNGRFKGSAEMVFKELADTYGLTWYYDGVTMHIYSIAEVETRLLQVDPIDVTRIDRSLKQMGLYDARFPLRVSSVEGTVLVSGPPRYVELVDQVVGRVADSPSRPKAGVEVQVFRLRYARASDTVVTIGGVETRISGVANTLNALMGDPARAEDTIRNLPRTSRGLRGQGLAAIGNPPLTKGPSAASSPAPSALSNVVPGAPMLGGPTQSTPLLPSPNEPSGSRRDGIMVRADDRLNAVIVRDVRERMPTYAQLISALDVETPLVEVEATVIDVSDSKSEELGVDWRANGRRFDVAASPNNLAGSGAAPRNNANDLLYSNDPVSAGRGLIGTLLFGNERQYFLARVNALQQRGDANLIARPRVLTTDNTEAVLQSTKEFYVRVAGREVTDLYNVSLGLVLRVTPTLVDDEQGRRFKMQVRIEDGNTNSGQSVDQIPVVNRNAISTQAVVGEGQSMLIGGYTVEERSNGDQGVPGLSSVPVVGWLFKQRTNVVRRSERMFMITPRLISVNAATAPARTVPPMLPDERAEPTAGTPVPATAVSPASAPAR